ncbi:hypothetical protein OG301_17875 [Streptomyces platensis]|uniref:hypothetical protein n=1 Tax=Streptomyces platensis TaxID=58346 RepID=UPI002E813FC2|nr:hypothetical protein [Streptomyces platensis]WTI53095.1 hypothetical protein OG301_17875 [Streptomyces platensis]WUB81290.1 hypothetical protein OG424_20150 [Streptomyces platensis]
MSSDEPVSRSERLERLQAQLQGRPVGRRTPRAAPAPETGLLYGVMLRGAARLDAGLELTGLEEEMVSFLRVLLSEEEICEFGRAYRKEGAASRMFPSALTSRDLADGYAFEDLVADLPGMRGQVMAQPNMSLLDLDRLPEDGSLDSPEFVKALGDYGHGFTMVTASDHRPDAARASAPERVDVELKYFKCYRQSGEWGRDEIYWALSAASDTGVKQTSVTREYGGISSGDFQDFDAGTMLFTGQVQEFLTAKIIMWEADHSPGAWQAEMRRTLVTISDFLFELAEKLKWYGGHYPVPEYHEMIDYIEIAGMIALVIVALIELFTNYDDLVLERTFVFDRAALVSWIDRGEVWGWDFDGGSGGHSVLVAAARGPLGSHPRMTSAISAATTTWGPDTALPATWTISGAPALTARRDTLLCVSRGHDVPLLTRGRLYWSTYNGSSWSQVRQVPNAQNVRSSAALATDHQTTYCLYTTTDNKLHATVFDGTSWTHLGTHSVTAYDTPALAFHGTSLICVIRGSGGRLLWADVRDGNHLSFTSWFFQPMPGPDGCSRPALTRGADGAAYLVALGPNFVGMYWSKLSSFWSDFARIPGGQTVYPAALANSFGKIHCVIKAPDKSHELRWSALTDTTWSPFVKHPTATSNDAPALAYVHGSNPAAGPDAPYGRLFCVYRD